MAVWLHPLLKEKKADDVLYHHNNRITEFPRSNVFAVINNVLVTPARDMLKGMTRKFVLEQAALLYQQKNEISTLRNCITFPEIFLTSTTKRVMPVLRVNDKVIENGTPCPVAAAMWELFMKMEQQL